jgi:hypothetical protein
LLLSEPGVSGGCVADPVARAKGDHEKLDTFTVPWEKGATGRSYQPVNRMIETQGFCQSHSGPSRLVSCLRRQRYPEAARPRGPRRRHGVAAVQARDLAHQ